MLVVIVGLGILFFHKTWCPIQIPNMWKLESELPLYRGNSQYNAFKNKKIHIPDLMSLHGFLLIGNSKFLLPKNSVILPISHWLIKQILYRFTFE